MLAACGASPQAETHHAATASLDEEACHDGAELLALPVDLELSIVAAFARCDGATRDFVVTLDHHVVGSVRVPCAEVVGVIRAPPPSYRLESVPVRAGTHELEVRDSMTGRSESVSITTPALLVSSDGDGVFAGAAIQVWASEEELRIGEPTAFRSGML